MLNYIKENIIQSQELAKSKINLLLESYGYSLTKDEHNKKGVETRLIQWENVKNNHLIELIWDGKEDWFDLREFESIDNLNYNSSKQITLVKFYRNSKFIKILKLNSPLGSGNVLNTNNCEISICDTRFKNKVVIFSAIDNLVKGASGQAIQNMNQLYKYPEYLGLR